MKYLLALCVFMLSLSAHAQGYSDPCQDPRAIKSSAVINIGSATTAVIVERVAAKAIYVCHIYGSLAGTTPSLVFKYGTKVTNDCDTGAVSLTGTILPLTGSLMTMGYGGTLMTAPAGTQLCGTAGGTPSIQGVLTYVQ